mmetsp:Transcript_12222/g.18409  ORF Transcript_12222/g.18409 Transcript_12222/m.18409 type:complete len:226 (-) Transcript_12222:336-1013(-)
MWDSQQVTRWRNFCFHSWTWRGRIRHRRCDMRHIFADPLVMQHLLNFEALFWIDAQQRSHQVFGVVIDGIPGGRLKIERSLHNILIHFVQLARRERMVAAQRDVQNAAERPQIHLIRVMLIGEHLGCHIQWSAHFGVHQEGRQIQLRALLIFDTVLLGIDLFCRSKISKFDRATALIKQHILRLQISVHDMMLMQKLNASRHFIHDASAIILRQTFATILINLVC